MSLSILEVSDMIQEGSMGWQLDFLHLEPLVGFTQASYDIDLPFLTLTGEAGKGKGPPVGHLPLVKHLAVRQWMALSRHNLPWDLMSSFWDEEVEA